MSTPEPVELPLGKVVGENVKRHREFMRWTQHELSQHLRRNGVNWTRGQIAAVEAGGREGIDAGVLIALAAALRIGVAGLLRGEGTVSLTPDAKQTREGVRAVLSGRLDMDLEFSDRMQVSQRSAEMRYEADAALAKRLGVAVDEVMAAARALFSGRTLTEERDLRVKVLFIDSDEDMGIAEQQAHRGHITRELSREIEAALGKRMGEG